MSNQQKEAGFSLIELIASIAVLSVVVLVFLAIFQQFFIVSYKNEENLIAMNLARKALVVFQENQDDLQNNFYSGNGGASDTVFNIADHGKKQNNFLELLNVEIITNELFKFKDTEEPFYLKMTNISKYEQNGKPLYDLYAIHIQVFDSPTYERLVAETFGYISTRKVNDKGQGNANK
jgi:prepilin-type N-terminal cleavage/methylation domain-containing protein